MKNKIFILLTIVAGIIGLSSCLDDTADNWKVDVAGKMYATVENPTLQALTLKPVPDTVEYSFMVNIATDKLPTKDITLKLKIDPAAVTAYNTQTGKSYSAFPNVEIVNPEVTIAKGTRNALVYVKVWGADMLNACDNFIAAVSIDSASDDMPIPSNMKTSLMSLPISNPYEGQYHSVGTFIHPTAGSRVIDEDKTLSTVDCKTVKTTVGDLGGYDLIMTVNDDNTVTISGGLGSSQLLVQTGVNVYDPSTKTFTVNYYYVGSGGNRVISEVLTKL